MRRKARIDQNQNEVVRQLRNIPGVTVRITSMVGEGFADFVIGYKKRNFLIELKNSKNIPSKKKLTPEEEKFFQAWTGQVDKAETIEDCLKIIGLFTPKGW